MNPKLNLLYVDDERINLMLFEANFNEHFQITTAGSGEGGLQILKKNPNFQVVISDLRMGGMDGLEFVTLAKKLYPSIKFYLLSGYEPTPEIDKAIKKGIILKYFMKPFCVEEILGAINSACP